MAMLSGNVHREQRSNSGFLRSGPLAVSRVSPTFGLALGAAIFRASVLGTFEGNDVMAVETMHWKPHGHEKYLALLARWLRV